MSRQKGAFDVQMPEIELREALHFLGWRGTPVDSVTLAQLRSAIREAREGSMPRVILRRFSLADGLLCGTSFAPLGKDIENMLRTCGEAVLIAGTLGAESERLLLRAQARDAAYALLLDAALSAGIESVMDAQEDALRAQIEAEGLFLTDRFSPGYGDMPLEQTQQICEVLAAQRSIGLTVADSGVMIPRKSVTAIMGVSSVPVRRRPKGCEGCTAKTCALRRMQTKDTGERLE